PAAHRVTSLLVRSDDHGQGSGAHARVADAFRLEYARVVASVLRTVRDIDLAEEIVQEAFEQALDRWPKTGTPDRPGAWLGSCAPSERSATAPCPMRCPKASSSPSACRPCSRWST